MSFRLSSLLLPALEYHIPIVQKPAKIPLRRNTLLSPHQHIRLRLLQPPGFLTLLHGALTLGNPKIRLQRFNIRVNGIQPFQQLLRGEYYVLHSIFVVGVQHEHPIVRWGLADLFPVKCPPAAGEQLVAVFRPAVGQEEVLGELYLQRRGLFVGFVGNEQVDAGVFRGHPYVDFIAVRVSQVLLYVGAYQILAGVDGE